MRRVKNTGHSRREWHKTIASDLKVFLAIHQSVLPLVRSDKEFYFEESLCAEDSWTRTVPWISPTSGSRSLWPWAIATVILILSKKLSLPSPYDSLWSSSPRRLSVPSPLQQRIQFVGRLLNQGFRKKQIFSLSWWLESYANDLRTWKNPSPFTVRWLAKLFSRSIDLYGSAFNLWFWFYSQSSHYVNPCQFLCLLLPRTGVLG